MFEDRQKARARIPGEWREREASLQLRLVKREEDLLRAQKDGDVSKIQSLQASRFRLHQRIRRLQESLRETNPDFFRMQQLSTPVSMDSVRRYVLKSPEQSMISYFLGDTWLYAIQVRQDTTLFLRKTIPDRLNEKINRLRYGIFGYWTLRAGCESGTLQGDACDSLTVFRQQYAQAYQEEAYQLYRWLFEEWQSELTSELIISPDGLLSFLPFEALLTKAVKNESWQQLPYFIQKHQLSYAYSATVLYQQVHRITATKPAKLLAIAPFSGSSNLASAQVQQASAAQHIEYLRSGHWGKLAYSGVEVEQIHDIWGGALLLDDQAAKAEFLQVAPRYNVLHLATHAKAHDYEPLLSLLAFADTFAPLPELAGEHLPAELVVLSACESGLGQLQDGEGVISLARAFTQAGARAMVTTLWSVEDRATAQIMADFYRYLKEGLSKDAALRQARIDYFLKAEPEFAHPFFWAGLTASGNMEALRTVKTQKLPLWQLGLGLFVILILLGLTLKNYIKR
jgi:CHAT domain-containing protein